jgi:hypothetical protein
MSASICLDDLRGIEAFSLLSDSEAGRVFRALMEWDATGRLPELKRRCENIALRLIAPLLEALRKAREGVSERQRERATKRWEADNAGAMPCDAGVMPEDAIITTTTLNKFKKSSSTKSAAPPPLVALIRKAARESGLHISREAAGGIYLAAREAGAEPSWFSGPDNVIEFIIGELRARYKDKPARELTALFVSVQKSDKEDFFTRYKEKREAALRSEEARAAREKKEAAAREKKESGAPRECKKCGALLRDMRCPSAHGVFKWDEEKELWEWIDTEVSLMDGYLKNQAARQTTPLLEAPQPRQPAA